MPKKTKTYYLRNFTNPCCLKWLKHCLNENSIQLVQMLAGQVSVVLEDGKDIEAIIKKAGFSILKDKDLIKVESIKQAVYELVQLQSNQNSIIQKSDYLIEKLGMSYLQISKIFSRYMPLTLEKYIIKHKIEKIKDLLDEGEYTLSEIAYTMDYSSVAHLSAQFKKETGFTVSNYKAMEVKPREDLSIL